MIEVFGFNTTNGGMFEMRNTTVEEIKSALKERFPKWNDAAIERAINNQDYYKEVIPVEKERKIVKKGSISKETISINDYELNPVLKLGQSVHCYNKWGHQSWGSTKMDKIFKNSNISSMYEKFELSYSEVVTAIKSKPRASKNEIKNKVISMCDSMVNLKSAVEKSGLLDTDANEDYICGYTSPGKDAVGHKLGMAEIVARIGEICGECTESLQ